ncbi:uncharacterized protein IL334_001255 [Kwoniella shivajii]|uniref:Uncharacterized protein n=1 Tax=Kwoniella shivajii TaxID=564305 RepID=A0ABZ1CRK6_9TREE|nr:hypothetical protein IL334_001255 [Kwoniella shivajii]
MRFTGFLFSAIAIAPAAFSAPTTLIVRQSTNTSSVTALDSSSFDASKVSMPATTITSQAQSSRTETVSASITQASSTVSHPPTNSTGLHFTNTFPDELKNGDKVELKWDGADGPYILYTIVSYPGLSSIRPNVIERNTDVESYSLIINEDDSHDKSTLTIGIASNKDSGKYKRITLPLVK